MSKLNTRINWIEYRIGYRNTNAIIMFRMLKEKELKPFKLTWNSKQTNEIDIQQQQEK